MTPPTLTGSDLAAWHRSEAARIEAEEKAKRPALAAGQVWRRIEDGAIYITFCNRNLLDGAWISVSFDGHSFVAWSGGEVSKEWEYVGLARDVLRVVVPEPPAAPQDVPEPTGAELVGNDCWVRDAENEAWRGPEMIRSYIDGDVAFPYRGAGGGYFWAYAKLYREGVAP